MTYLRKYCRFYAMTALLVLAYHLYYIFLVHAPMHLLWYLDVLLLSCFALFMGVDMYRFYMKRKQRKALLDSEHILTPLLQDEDGLEVARHDVQLLQIELQQQENMHKDLQDYIMKWCHEVKLPLAAAMLMNEQIQEIDVKRKQIEQLEKISQQLNMALVGCRVQSNIYDLQIKRCALEECVRSSIRNNQFFLILHRFDMKICVEKEAYIYTDVQWLVYVLDQLLSNAIKYRKTPCSLHIWSETTKDAITLYVEDHGEGICSQDLRRIFEKGFTGTNQHNGRYRSTGMGLYMVSIILKKLNHTIGVESEEGRYTRFMLTFRDNRSYFHV